MFWPAKVLKTIKKCKNLSKYYSIHSIKFNFNKTYKNKYKYFILKVRIAFVLRLNEGCAKITVYHIVYINIPIDTNQTTVAYINKRNHVPKICLGKMLKAPFSVAHFICIYHISYTNRNRITIFQLAAGNQPLPHQMRGVC